MDIHKHTHKTYALHTIISGFLPQVHFKKKKSIQLLSFFYKLVIYYVVILVFVAELQSNSLQRWLRISVRSSVLVIFLLSQHFMTKTSKHTEN